MRRAFFVSPACNVAASQETTAISSKTELLLETLLAPFEEGAVPTPTKDASAFLIRAEASPWLNEDWKKTLVCEQTLRTDYDLLKEADYNVTTSLEGQFNLGMCLFTKHKKENYGNIARAFDHLNVGGTLICVGHNNIGVKSLEKNIGKEIPLDGKYPKPLPRILDHQNRGTLNPCRMGGFPDPSGKHKRASLHHPAWNV